MTRSLIIAFFDLLSVTRACGIPAQTVAQVMEDLPASADIRRIMNLDQIHTS
jgi:hypothetical protein